METTIQLAAIGGTLGLLWLLLQALRRFRGGDAPRGRVQVQQRIPLANGCQLVVIHWDGREMLLATGNHPCTLVASKPAGELQTHTEASGTWAR
jgi:hypothetical protein